VFGARRSPTAAQFVADSPLEGDGFELPVPRRGQPLSRLPFERSGPAAREKLDPARKGEAVSGRVTWALQRLQPGNEPPRLPSAGEARPRQEGGHEQLSNKRAQEQADEAVDGGSEGQIELRCVFSTQSGPHPECRESIGISGK
jgi:hypothetical protein